MTKPSYEDLLKDLDIVINKLSQDTATLDESVELFTKGITLIGECRSQLDQAMERVNVLIRQNNGQLEKAPANYGTSDNSNQNDIMNSY